MLILVPFFIVSFCNAMHKEFIIRPFNEKVDNQFISDLLLREQKSVMTRGKFYSNTYKEIKERKVYITKVLVKKDNQKPIGFIAFSIHQSSFCGCSSKGIIDFLIVHPQYRKKGYGKKLLLHAIEELKDESVSEIGLYLNPDNKNGIAFCCKFNIEKQPMFPSFFDSYYIIPNKEHAE